MNRKAGVDDTARVFCEVCASVLPRAKALRVDTKDYAAYFCGPGCYESYRHAALPATPPLHEAQGGHGRRRSLDQRMKRVVRQHPQRDEPRVDSVESDELPPP